MTKFIQFERLCSRACHAPCKPQILSVARRSSTSDTCSDPQLPQLLQSLAQCNLPVASARYFSFLSSLSLYHVSSPAFSNRYSLPLSSFTSLILNEPRPGLSLIVTMSSFSYAPSNFPSLCQRSRSTGSTLHLHSWRVLPCLSAPLPLWGEVYSSVLC